MANQTDPTEKGRQLVGGALKSLIPSSSPLGQSLAKDDLNKEIAAMESAGQLGADVPAASLPDGDIPLREGMGKLIPVPAGTTPEQVAAAPQPIKDLANMTGQVPKEYVDGVNEAQAGIQKQDRAAASITPPQADSLAGFDQQTPEQIKSARDIDEAQLKVDAARNDLKNAKIEPKSFWAGKSTWQKVVSGIGIALSSLTPQTAQNAVKIMQDEVQRDVDIQRANLQNKKDLLSAADEGFKAMVVKYGNVDAAVAQQKRLKLATMDHYASQLEAKAKNANQVAQIQLMRRAADREDKKLQMDFAVAMEKAQKSNQDGRIPGYDGFISDKTEARGFRKALADRDSALATLKDLESLTDKFGKSLSPSLRAKGDQLSQDLQLQLKEIKALGVLSGDDSKRLDSYIENPAQFFKFDSTSKVQQQGLRKLINRAISAREKSLGIAPNNRVKGERDA